MGVIKNKSFKKKKKEREQKDRASYHLIDLMGTNCT